MEIEKIGETNYKKFKTEFKVLPKVKNYLEEEDLSLGVLIPDGHLWYEQILFDVIDQDEDGKPDEKFGKNIVVIYNGITEESDWNENQGLVVKGLKEQAGDNKKLIFSSSSGLTSSKDPKKVFRVNYSVFSENEINNGNEISFLRN